MGKKEREKKERKKKERKKKERKKEGVVQWDYEPA